MENTTLPPPAPEPRPMPHWLTPRQVASCLQVSLRFVQHLIKRGELPASSLGDSGKVIRVDTGELKCYMAGRRTPAHIK